MKFEKSAIAFAFLCAGPLNVWADPYLFGFTNLHEVVSLITNDGTYLTSGLPFNPGANNSGWWSADVPREKANDNYFVGFLNSYMLNDFFSFFIPSGISVVTSASLNIPRGLPGFPTTSGVPLTYSLYDVGTPADMLNTNVGTNATIFNDLGSGVLYGSTVVADLTLPDPLLLLLDPAAVADLNAAKGTWFSIGGTINTGFDVAEPSSGLTLGFGFLTIGLRVLFKNSFRSKPCLPAER